ncbi:MAG: ATP-binding cassette domain-containing protein [Proteobacteria bacterium]|nr:ATP-binding cassette domain-containing protein [Pseudomonadota bacterium]MBU1745982.1 ATP-binding cassette domain-containing protein [Pseudomonadota bacterium]MBU1965417.1 ATP-binding cassette domain-containing protein [Pseudomonadota bacterium]
MNDLLLDIRDLKKHFPAPGGFLSRGAGVIRAVDGVALQVQRGETLGLVGESGCGKSTLARTILRLEAPTAGQIRFEGEDILAWKGGALNAFRRKVQMIFQDPYSSLNPRQTAGGIIEEPLHIHHYPGGREEIKKKLRELASVVGLDEEQLTRYPHEFSGGQRQRIGIARALILKPRLVIADEPVSALDVSIRAQILNLLKRLQREFDLTYLFITHDLGVVRHMSDRIAVMYLGKIVELGGAEQVCGAPAHPYTKALLSAMPSMDPLRKSERTVLCGDMPSPAAPPQGCAFHPRCPVRIGVCDKREPLLEQAGAGHWVACHITGC